MAESLPAGLMSPLRPAIAALVALKRAYDAGLKTLADLPGHSVGITQIGSTFHYSLGLIADKLKLDIATVRVTPLQTLSAVVAAIQGGQPDAALTAAATITPIVASTATVLKQRSAIEKGLAAYRRGADEYSRVLLQRDAPGAFVRSAEGDAAAIIDKSFVADHPATNPK